MKFRIEYLFVGLFVLLMSVGMRQLANSFYIIHDNLDSEVIFKTEPSQEGVFFSFSNKQSVNGLLGEIPRNSYTCSPFNLVSIIFYFFPASWALYILTALVRATAFFGMFLFLRQIASIENKAIMRNAVIGFLSLGFAFLPFYSIHGLAIAGLPFLMYFLMLLRLGKNPILCFSGILVYGLSSSFVLGGYAVLILLFAYSSYLFLIKQEAKWRFFLAALFLMFGLILSDSGLFLQFLFDAQYVSHRSEWVLTGLNWKASFYAMMDLFINGQYHAPSEHLPLLLFSPFLFFLNWKSLDYKRWLLSTAVLLICIILFYGLYKSVYFLNLRNGISFLKAFQLDRFYFLLPVVWVVFYFLISLSDIAWKQYISLVGAVGFCVFSFMKNAEWKANIIGSSSESEVIQWKEYFGEGNYSSLHNLLPPSESYRIIHYGIDPAIGVRAGYYSVDGYHTNYPLKHKQAFQKLVQQAILVNESYQKSLNEWGSKLIYPINKRNEFHVNWEEAQKLNLKYVFSNAQLKPNEHIHYVGTVQNFNANGDLLIYEIS